MKLNPNASVIGKENTILSGTARQYHVADFEGVLSIKTTVLGEAVWSSDGRIYTVTPGSWLHLNDEQRYSISIDSATPVTTFCLFFRRGLAGEILDTLRNPIERSLERPSAMAFNPELRVRLRPRETDVDLLIRRMHALLSMEFDADWDSIFMKAALYLIQDEGEIYQTALSLKAKRLSTRTEVQRRVFRGRDYLLSNLRRSITTEEAAREASMAPFHFHRSFHDAFGQTPHGFLRSERMKLARHYCERTSLPATEICALCGYASLGTFSSTFSAFHHTSFLTLRKKARLKNNRRGGMWRMEA